MQFSPQGGNGTVFAPSDAGAGGRTPRIIINIRRGQKSDAVLGKIKFAAGVCVKDGPYGNLFAAYLDTGDDAQHRGGIIHGDRQ